MAKSARCCAKACVIAVKSVHSPHKRFDYLSLSAAERWSVAASISGRKTLQRTDLLPGAQSPGNGRGRYAADETRQQNTASAAGGPCRRVWFGDSLLAEQLDDRIAAILRIFAILDRLCRDRATSWRKTRLSALSLKIRRYLPVFPEKVDSICCHAA